MAASADAIRAAVESYVELVGSGTADDVVALFADGATVEDPVGTPVRTTRESIHEFYAALEPLDSTTVLKDLRIVAGEAVFSFEIHVSLGERTVVTAPFDHMVFDDAGKITAMRAFWSDDDVTQR